MAQKPPRPNSENVGAQYFPIFININQQRASIQFENLANSIAGFSVFLQAQLAAITQNLVASGVSVARKKLRSSTTEWGEARMSGNRFGVSFARYGRTSGREETGFMYDSLSSKVELAPSGKTMWRGTYGWEDSIIRQHPYILMQERGFESTGKFDPIATAASGRASFTEGRLKWVKGAGSMAEAYKSINNRAPAAYSAARNEAIKLFKAGGFKGNPKKYADIKPLLGDRAPKKQLLLTRFFDDLY